MIPHRMLSNETLTNDMKNRVTACRKRLRLSRIKAHSDKQVEFPETAVGASEFGDQSEHDPAGREHLRDYEAS